MALQPVIGDDIIDADLPDIVDDVPIKTDYIVPTVIVGDLRADIYEVTIDAYCAVMGEVWRDILEIRIRHSFGDAPDMDSDDLISGLYPAIVRQSNARLYAEARGVRLPSFRDYATMTLDDGGDPVLGNVLRGVAICAFFEACPKIATAADKPNASGMHNLYGNASEWTDTDFVKFGLQWSSCWPLGDNNAYDFGAATSVTSVAGFRCVEDIE